MLWVYGIPTTIAAITAIAPITSATNWVPKRKNPANQSVARFLMSIWKL
jgi:hypothetical protein